MSRHEKIEEKAAEWVIRREEPSWSEEDEAALKAWLAESDLHNVTYWRLEHGWRQADRIGSLGADATIVHEPRRWESHHWLGGVFAAAASLALAFAVFTLNGGLPFGGETQVETAQFSTDLGARKTVSFADGTQVELNSSTAIRAAVGADERAVWLDRGEAFFEVAKRSGEEFVVHAGPQTVTVIGTKFSVRRLGPKVIVAVLDGRVRLAKPTGTPAILSAGDLAVSDEIAIAIEPGDVAAIQRQLAWREGLLVFDNVSLADAAEEFNRYNRKQLVITDPATAGMRIGGSFQATNVEAFSRLLDDAYGLKVDVGSDKISVSG